MGQDRSKLREVTPGEISGWRGRRKIITEKSGGNPDGNHIFSSITIFSANAKKPVFVFEAVLYGNFKHLGSLVLAARGG